MFLKKTIKYFDCIGQMKTMFEQRSMIFLQYQTVFEGQPFPISPFPIIAPYLTILTMPKDIVPKKITMAQFNIGPRFNDEQKIHKIDHIWLNFSEIE